MEIVRRNTEVNIETISNGFIITLNGRNLDGNWITEKTFLTTLDLVKAHLENYFDLPLAD